MGTRDLSGYGLEPADAVVVGRYLDSLDALLPAGRRARREILDELADGLACAIADAPGTGRPAGDAARAAVAECGDPRTVAAAFSRRIGPAVAHRLGLGLLVSGPMVGLSWVAAYATGADWPRRVGLVLSAVPVYPLILAVTVPAAIIAIIGSGAQHLRISPRAVTTAGLVAAVGCVAGDLSLLAAVAGHRLPAAGPAGLVAVAAVASAARLSAAGLAGRRIARLRAAAR